MDPSSFELPTAELTVRAVRAGGPGGQHVNRSATRVELRWDFGSSDAIDDEAKTLIRERLAARLDAEGRLLVAEGTRRSQLQNRAAATERMERLVREALRPVRPRKPTKVPKSAKEARLRAKQRRAETKARRKKPEEE